MVGGEEGFSSHAEIVHPPLEKKMSIFRKAVGESQAGTVFFLVQVFGFPQKLLDSYYKFDRRYKSEKVEKYCPGKGSELRVAKSQKNKTGSGQEFPPQKEEYITLFLCFSSNGKRREERVWKRVIPPFPLSFLWLGTKKMCNSLSFFSLMFSLIYVVPSHQEGFFPPPSTPPPPSAAADTAEESE